MPRSEGSRPPPPLPPGAAGRRAFAGVLLIGYAFLLCDKAVTCAGGADSSGYLNAARLLARGKLSDSVEPLTRLNLSQDFIRVFIPLGFSPGIEPGTMVPSYPLGLPLHMAAAGLVGGWARAPFLVSPLAAALCLLLVYGIGRELGMSRPFAAAAAACLAVFPTFVWSGLQPMSDVPATAWALAAVLAALRARRNPAAAYLCGAALGMAVLVRPTNLLLAFPLLVVLPLEGKALLRVAVGGLPFAAFLLATNQIAHGSPFASGYGDMSSGFSVGFLPARIRHYGYWLAALGTPFLALGWLAVAGVRSLPLRTRLILVGWPAVFLLFFCFWQPYEAWWYTRFLLPGAPAMYLAMMFVLERGFRPRAPHARKPEPPRHRTILGIAVVGIVFATGVYWIRKHDVMSTNRGEQIYPEACRWAASAVPSNAILGAMQMTGAMRYYTNLTFARLDWIDSDHRPALQSQVRAAGDRWYALVTRYESELLQKGFPGSWREIGQLRDVILLRLEDTSP